MGNLLGCDLLLTSSKDLGVMTPKVWPQIQHSKLLWQRPRKSCLLRIADRQNEGTIPFQKFPSISTVAARLYSHNLREFRFNRGPNSHQISGCSELAKAGGVVRNPKGPRHRSIHPSRWQRNASSVAAPIYAPINIAAATWLVRAAKAKLALRATILACGWLWMLSSG
jgi:hypothetical protein